MLYDTAARACEVLALDMKDRDLRNHCAKVRRKGRSRRPTWLLPRGIGVGEGVQHEVTPRHRCVDSEVSVASP
jgi:integrase